MRKFLQSSAPLCSEEANLKPVLKTIRNPAVLLQRRTDFYYLKIHTALVGSVCFHLPFYFSWLFDATFWVNKCLFWKKNSTLILDICVKYSCPFFDHHEKWKPENSATTPELSRNNRKIRRIMRVESAIVVSYRLYCSRKTSWMLKQAVFCAQYVYFRHLDSQHLNSLYKSHTKLYI